MIGNKSAHKIRKVSRNSSQNSSETVEKETENAGFDREIAKERNTSSEKYSTLLMMEHYHNSIIMQYQKIMIFFDNTPNEPSKFRTKT